MEKFGFKGRSGEGLRCLLLKGGGSIIGAKSRMGMTSPPHIDTRGIEVRLTSGESLLETREQGRRRKEGVCQEDTDIKGIPFKMGCVLKPVSL